MLPWKSRYFALLGRWAGRALVALPWLYVVALSLAWALLRFASDHWWFGTLMLFGPRWICALPLLVLIPLCLYWDRRRWPVVLLGAIIVWFPVMDFCSPWGRLFLPAGTRYRVLTCNLHDDGCNPDALQWLILREDPDFVALQECDFVDVRPALVGYHVVMSKRLLVASRFPLREIKEVNGAEPPHAFPRKHAAICVADTPIGELTIGCVHLPSPRIGLSNVLDRRTGLDSSRKEILEENIRLRREESTAVKEILDKSPERCILAGDFNTPVESAVYRECWGRYRNAFSRTGFGFGSTIKCRVRFLSFGVRIDHILSGPKVTPARCWIGPDIGSAHLPVVADLICE
jgi:vancomycin resistance protein VanJ